MQVTITSLKSHKPSFHFHVGKGFLLSVAVAKASLICGALYVGIELGKSMDSPEKEAYRNQVETLDEQVRYAQKELNGLNLQMEASLDSILLEIGSIKGRLLTIAAKQDAEGMHSGFDSDDFNETKERLEKNVIEFKNANNIMDFWIAEKQDLNNFLSHLSARESILDAKTQSDLQDEAYQFINRPVADSDAWLSSRYGYRKDPFTGNRRWHDGVDFAGREGGEILAASSGIVTFAGDRYGYGNLVEISHSDGVVTRYGHNKEILVEKGDQVDSGQVIAKMGNSGRSTGPHVHFEVLHHGRSKNPLNYLGNPLKKPD